MATIRKGQLIDVLVALIHNIPEEIRDADLGEDAEDVLARLVAGEEVETGDGENDPVAIYTTDGGRAVFCPPSEEDEFDDTEDEAFMARVERGEAGLYGEEEEIEIDDDEDWTQPFVGDNDHGDATPTDFDADYEGGRP